MPWLAHGQWPQQMMRERVLMALVALVLVSSCGTAAEKDGADSSGTRAQLADTAAASAATPHPGESSTLPRSSPAASGEFRLAGNEPFWGVRITATGIVYSTPDYPKGIAFSAASPQVSGTSLRWVAITAPPDAHTLDVTLEAKPCQDSMSDKRWTHVASVVFDGTTLSGCGERTSK